MKKFALFGLIIMLTMAAFGQRSKVTTAALKMKSGELLEAREAIDIAKDHPKTKDDAKTWNYRGEIYFRLYSSKEFTQYDSVALDYAFESFQKSVKLDEKEKYKQENIQGIDAVRQIYFQQSNQYFENEQYDKAYAAINKYLKGNELIRQHMGEEIIPTDTMSVFRKGYYAQLSGMEDTAMKIYDDLVAMKFDKVPFLYESYFSMLKERDNIEKALEVIRQGQELYPTNADLVITELNYFLSTGQADKAINRFKKAIELDSANPDLHFALGTVFDNLYDSRKDTLPEQAKEYKANAIEYYKNALEIDPNYFKAVYNIGVIKFNEGVEISKLMNNLPMSAQDKYEKLKVERNEVFTEALPFLEKAHQLKPEDLPTMKALKEIYFRLGEMEKYKKMNEALKQKLGGGE